MLYIGGSRDGQREYILFNGDRCVLPIKQVPERYSRLSLLSAPLPIQTELYVKKAIWRKRRHMFFVMVKDGSEDLLDAFLIKYNKKKS